MPIGHAQLCTTSHQISWWEDLNISAAATQNISEVENVWRELEKSGIQSPGQSFDFTKAWIKNFEIAADEQLYVTGAMGGKVVALLPLQRKKLLGANVLTWFFGSHVGCNGPLVDKQALAALDAGERKKLWQRMGRAMVGADLVHLQAMAEFDGLNLFDELGEAVEEEFLYRAQFDSWEECQKVQRTKSRKKHDKQQISKLKAIGEVEFEEIAPGEEALAALKIMFAQKAIRFEQMGVKNPFEAEEMQKFYNQLFRNNNVMDAKLHVLKVDGEIVAVRYNLGHNDKIFTLIASMSKSDKYRSGSPGKQNILQGVRASFEKGYKIFDMGAGYLDEKRRWCNKKLPLTTRYYPLTNKGRMVAKLHMLKTRVKKFIKENDRLFDLYKQARLVIAKNS